MPEHSTAHPIPANLLSLHRQEEQLRAHAMTLIAAHGDLSDHLTVTECAMDLLDSLRQHGERVTDDDSALIQLGLRVFNDFAAGWKLVSCGYFQAGAMVMRDIIETVNLVEFLLLDRSRIALWHAADEKTRRDTFKPVRIRQALDDAMGKGPSNRGAIYKTFSTLAAHPTIEGLQMLRPTGMDAVLGPFMDVSWLRRLLEEQAKRALHAGMVFSRLSPLHVVPSRVAAHSMVVNMMNWMERYHGASFSAEAREETERLLTTL